MVGVGQAYMEGEGQAYRDGVGQGDVELLLHTSHLRGTHCHQLCKLQFGFFHRVRLLCTLL